MSRKRKAPIRKVYPDPRFHSEVISKFINSIMYDGKRSTAEKILYESLDLIDQKVKGETPIDIFKKALENVAPVVEVKSKRVGGTTYQVPLEVSQNRRIALAMRWILSYARSRKGKTMSNRLASELIAASNKEGSAYKKKEDTHKMAEANKAFAHFR